MVKRFGMEENEIISYKYEVKVNTFSPQSETQSRAHIGEYHSSVVYSPTGGHAFQLPNAYNVEWYGGDIVNLVQKNFEHFTYFQNQILFLLNSLFG